MDQTIKIVDLDQKKVIEDLNLNFEVNSIVYIKDKEGEKVIFTIDVKLNLLKDIPKQLFNGEVKNL